jgi:hypothetical protein
VQVKKQDENRGYAAELIAILLQDNRETRTLFGKEDGVETLLTVVSVCVESVNHDSNYLLRLSTSK